LEHKAVAELLESDVHRIFGASAPCFVQGVICDHVCCTGTCGGRRFHIFDFLGSECGRDNEGNQKQSNRCGDGCRDTNDSRLLRARIDGTGAHAALVRLAHTRVSGATDGGLRDIADDLIAIDSMAAILRHRLGRCRVLTA